jgi:parvulin-like peptidyl-prolyl isomerase
MKHTLLFLVLFGSQLLANDFEVIARVNGRFITKYDLQHSKKAINDLIRDHIREEAIADNGIEFNQNEFDDYKGEYGNDDKLNYLWQKLIAKKIIPSINISKNEIDESLEYMGDDEYIIKYNISEILFEKNDLIESIVNKIYNEIKEKDNFIAMANKFSKIGRGYGGFIGWVDSKDMNSIIQNELKNTKVKDITKPILIDGDFLIVRLNDIEKTKIVKNEDIYKTRKSLYNQKITIEIEKYYNTLYNNAMIEIK